MRRRASARNEVWGMHFVQDRIADARPFRMLSVLDEHIRECLALEVGRHFRGEDFVAVLDELTAIRVAPAHVRSDHGPEFVSAALRRWCAESGTGKLYVDPGSPWLDGIVESFNGRLWEELLASELFETLAEASYLVDRRRLHYILRRPQRPLGKKSEAGFAATCPAVPSLRLAAVWHREARNRSLPAPDSQKGWAEETDPVNDHRKANWPPSPWRRPGRRELASGRVGNRGFVGAGLTRFTPPRGGRCGPRRGR